MNQEEDRSKSLYMANENGEYSAYSTEEILSKDLNKYKGWFCAAGAENIHITADGNVVLAACQVNGEHGNVYKGDVEIPKNWVRCTEKACMCGGDMQIRKIKEYKYKEQSLQPHPEKRVEEVKDVKWVAPLHYRAHSEHPKTISWDMGRRCNFKCSYCHPLVSNQKDPLLTWDQLKLTTDKMIECYGKGDGMKWVITGGEPTIIPTYMDWAKYVRELGHIIHTTTNGSRGPDYLGELIEYSCIGLSLHLEHLNMEKLVESCKAIIAKKKAHKEASWWWFGVRIMVPPRESKKAIEVRERLLEIPDFLDYCQVMLSPIHGYTSVGQDLSFGELEDYDLSELAEIQKYS